MGKTSFLNKGLSWTQHDTTAESLPAPDSCLKITTFRHEQVIEQTFCTHFPRNQPLLLHNPCLEINPGSG
jgi:hypothetical protein